MDDPSKEKKNNPLYLSMIMAIPIPPPIHMDINPVLNQKKWHGTSSLKLKSVYNEPIGTYYV